MFIYVGEKRISFEEFLPLYHTFSKKKTGGSFEHFAEAFRIFDRESNGMVSMAEIRHLLTSLGKSKIAITFIINRRILESWP